MAKLREQVVSLCKNGSTVADIMKATREDKQTVLRCIATAKRLSELPATYHFVEGDLPEEKPTLSVKGAVVAPASRPPIPPLPSVRRATVSRPIPPAEARQQAEEVFRAQPLSAMTSDIGVVELEPPAVAPPPEPAQAPPPLPIQPPYLSPTPKTVMGEAMAEALRKKTADYEDLAKQHADQLRIAMDEHVAQAKKIAELEELLEVANKITALPDSARIGELKERLAENQELFQGVSTQAMEMLERISTLEQENTAKARHIATLKGTIGGLETELEQLKAAPPRAVANTTDLIQAIVMGYGAGFDSGTIGAKAHISVSLVDQLLDGWRARFKKEEV